MDQIVAATERVWLKTLEDSFFLGQPILEYYFKHGKINHASGRKIVEPIIQARTNGQFYKGITAMAPQDNNEVGAAEYDWVFSEEYALIAGDEMWMNEGDAGKIKLWDSKVKIAGASLAERWGAALHADGNVLTGADTRLVPTPFEAMADDGNTFNVGGMTSDDVALWQGQRTPGGGAALTIKMVEVGYLAASEGRFHPDALEFSKAGYAMFFSLIQTAQRYVGADKKVGFQNLLFNDATVFADSNILTTGGNFTNQRLFYHNTDKCRLTCAEGMEFVTEEKQIDAHAYCQVIRFAGNFTTNGRRYIGVLDNFTV